MYIDFKNVIADHPIELVAERLGLKLTPRGNQLRGSCPSGEGGDRSFVITPEKGKWYSFAKETGGDVINLVAFVMNLPPKEAAAWIVGEDSISSQKKTKTERGFRELEYLVADHDAVEVLGFEPEIARQLGVGYAGRGIFKGKVCVPIRLSDGQLAGYIGITEAALPPKWEVA